MTWKVFSTRHYPSCVKGRIESKLQGEGKETTFFCFACSSILVWQVALVLWYCLQGLLLL
jgi:hypothetical protein